MADFGEDIAVSLVPDFRRFDQEYRAEIERIQRNAIEVPVKFSIDKSKLKADLEVAARELSRTTEIKVQVKLDTSRARAELAALRASAGIGGSGAIRLPGSNVSSPSNPFASLPFVGPAFNTIGPQASMAVGIPGGLLAAGAVASGLGAATAAVTGFAAALGTAKLAYEGLQRQAKQGVGFGADLAGEIGGIKRELSDLAQVAANAVGPGLEQAFGTIRDALPGLEPVIKELGGALGEVSANLGQGLVTGVQNAKPVFDAFSRVIVDLSQHFKNFTASDQFKQFMEFAASQLPVWEQLAVDIGKLMADAAPLIEAAAKGFDTLAASIHDTVAALEQFKIPEGLKWLASMGNNPIISAGTRAAFGSPFATAASMSNAVGAFLPTGTIANEQPVSPWNPWQIFGRMNGTRIVPPFPVPQLRAAGITPDSSEFAPLRRAINAPLLGGFGGATIMGGTARGGQVLGGGISALESRYGPAIQAMQGYRQAQGQVQQAVQQENQVEIQGAQQVSAAQASLAQARQAAAQSAIRDAQAIKSAEQAVADARRNAARVAQQNADAIQAAEQQITQAQENAAQAQKDLTQARADAARQLQDMARAAIDSGDALQSAQLHLQQLQLQQAARTGSKTPEEIFREYNQLTNAQNSLDLKSAQHQVTDAQITHTRAVDDNNKAQKKGVEGMPQVVAAKKAVRDANNAVTDSEKNLARVRQQAADAEIAASQQVGRAVQNLENTRRQAALDRIQNEQNVANAVTGVATAEDNAKQANNDAHQRTLDASSAAKQAGDNFKYQAAQVGETTGQIQKLAQQIAQGKFDLTATFTDKNGLQVRKDTIDVQRDLYEAVLIAGGKTPQQARAQALRLLPYPAQPSTIQPPGTPTGGRKIAASGGAVYGPGGPTDDAVGPYWLSSGEHVWTANEVAKAGGHEAIKRMRAFYAGLAGGGSPWDAQLMIDYKKMGLLAALRGWAHDHPYSAPAPTGTGGFPAPTAWHGNTGHLSPAQAMGAAQALMPVGWSWPSLRQLWIGESGWRWNATGAPTPMGNAYGIPQSLPGSKMAAAGPDWHDNAVTQIRWGIGYISGRYGNPTHALNLWNARDPHWYDAGGVLPPGMTVAVNASTKPEAVLSNAQWRLLRQLAAGGRRGPVMHVDQQIIQTPAAADALVRMLQFAALAGGGGL